MFLKDLAGPQCQAVKKTDTKHLAGARGSRNTVERLPNQPAAPETPAQCSPRLPADQTPRPTTLQLPRGGPGKPRVASKTDTNANGPETHQKGCRTTPLHPQHPPSATPASRDSPPPKRSRQPTSSYLVEAPGSRLEPQKQIQTGTSATKLGGVLLRPWRSSPERVEDSQCFFKGPALAQRPERQSLNTAQLTHPC